MRTNGNMDQTSLPLGKWNIYGNEEQGTLEITSVDSNRSLTEQHLGIRSQILITEPDERFISREDLDLR